MSLIIFVQILVPDERRIQLVYGIVCQMHLVILYIQLVWLYVFWCRQSAQPLPVYVYPQRIQTSQHHVYPQIKFASIYQHRVVEIFLNYHIIFQRKRRILCQVYASALTIRMRLDNIQSFLILLVTKKVILFGKNPSSRIKRILQFHNSLSQLEVNTKQILPSQLITTREMINPLIAFNSLNKLLSNIGVNPKQKDIIKMILFIIKLVIKILMH